MVKKNGAAILLMLFCAFCLASGQLIWKIMPNYNLQYLIAGFAIYAFGAASMILAYRLGELSILQPINSAGYIFGALAAFFILHEQISASKLIGIVFIIAGLIVLGSSNK